MLMDLIDLCGACLTVFVNRFGATIRNMFGCDCYFVVQCYGGITVGGGGLLDRPCMVFLIMCTLCL